MRPIYIISLLALVVAVSGCKDDDDPKGNLTLVFTSSFDGQPLVVTDVFDYAFDQRIQFTRSEFYCSDIRLVTSGGTTRELSEIELIDMTATNQQAAEDGVQLVFNDVPAGTYSQIGFGIGVPSGLNTTTPDEWPSGHVLSDPGRYWLPWNSYIFGKTEGRLDTIADGQDDLELSWLFHTGIDQYYLDVTANAPIEILEDGTTIITLDLNHRALMGLPDDPVDIKKRPINHNPMGNEDEYNKFVQNYADALTLTIE